MKAYTGFIQVDGQDMGLRIILPERRPGGGGGRLKGARVVMSQPLALLLEGLEGVLQKKVDQAEEIEELASEIRELAEKVRRGESHQKKQRRGGEGGAVRDAKYYSALVEELSDPSLDVVGVSDKLDQVQLRVRDVRGRSHTVTVVLPPDYPSFSSSSSLVCYADLPVALSVSSSSLAAVQQALAAAVVRYQLLWDTLDDLALRAWVLSDAPAASFARSSCTRRIVVAPHCYVQITLDPELPLALPQMRFLGADKATQPLVAAFNASAQLWDPADPNLAGNLEKCLGVRLEPRTRAEREEELHARACGICYEFALGQDSANPNPPDVVCGNARCGKSFHRLCLYEWLRAIPTTKVSFATVFGQCPCCETTLTFSTKQ